MAFCDKVECDNLIEIVNMFENLNPFVPDIPYDVVCVLIYTHASDEVPTLSFHVLVDLFAKRKLTLTH